MTNAAEFPRGPLRNFGRRSLYELPERFAARRRLLLRRLLLRHVLVSPVVGSVRFVSSTIARAIRTAFAATVDEHTTMLFQFAASFFSNSQATATEFPAILATVVS